MALSNSQYDAIMREYGRQQIENHHKLEERRKEIYARLPVVKQLEAEIAERSVACAKKLLEGDKGVLDRLKEDLRDLREQKALIIRAAGYPDDYLELHYRCPDCRDTGLVDGRKCHCFLQAQMKLLHAQSNLEDVLERENFKALNYEYYDDTEILPQLGITNAAYMRRVVAGCKEFVRDFDKKHDNLLFTGSTGVGKTFLTNCIARELMDDFHSVIYLTASDLFDVFSRNKFDYDNAEDMRDMYRFILDCDLLIIDDLGTELNNSFTSSQLFYCINERMNMSRSTIISTNLTLARLRDSYTDRVTSRIMSGYRIIPLYGGDIRLLKK
ncbi:DNA replication protein DnaC [Enterocloster clostridioformis]|uniref:ATP-binding protein n=1 Tax=Enterocloster clostridioformis TaxID=1531 RepID=UPI00080CAE69|nr:ATP-binding protein [Enterocloster clostridioformis]ANU46373.1 DNA replication protein DnaC [Lachnoclostridium sp. YL32]NDO31227.1 DNA replication protein DnaC [Enterocloster clostridioformis]OXE65091.1 DNA replication protein DnaC [Enterocloster clostridioformis]QQQ98904.1 ATP-binding protein [Enterocloster clostridioformis]